MDFKKISQQIRALDKPEKLKILALLAEEGRKSISAVARELNIHFSTTHKYLEQLEAANLVHSKSVKEDRLKRYFYVKDFDIRLSPTELTASAPSEKKSESFKVIASNGKVEDCTFDQLIRPYYEFGLPRASINLVLNNVKNKIYNGITATELHRLFKDALINRITNLTNAAQAIQASQKHRNTFLAMLKYFSPEILKMHEKGDIFITNLDTPALLNFAHDIRGIAMHGVQGKRAEKLEELFEQILFVFQTTKKYTVGSSSFDSFNYTIAPMAKKSDCNLKVDISNFFSKINKLGIIYISLDLGIPKFFEYITPIYAPAEFKYRGAEIDTYNNYQDTANKIADVVIKLIKTGKFPNIKLVFKKWDVNSKIPCIKNHYAADLSAKWQKLNANYLGHEVRFDYGWKRWIRTVRVGEMQNIIINLPRLALHNKSPIQFLRALDQLVSTCVDTQFSMAELAQGYFLRSRAKTSFITHGNRDWVYTHIDDCLYNISLLGLNEAVLILSGLPLEQNMELAEKILSTFKSIGEGQPIRLAVKEEFNPTVAARFYTLDKPKLKLEKVKINSYSLGVRCKDMDACAKLHKYLLGGHCASLPYDKLNTTDFGLARIA